MTIHRKFALSFIILLVFSACTVPRLLRSTEETDAEMQTVLAEVRQNSDGFFKPEACPVDVLGETKDAGHYSLNFCGTAPLSCLDDCRKDDRSACYALAIAVDKYTSDGEGGDDAQPLFSKACSLGVVSACTRSASRKYWKSSQVGADVACSFNTFRETCSRNDPSGCYMYGMMLGEKARAESDITFAIEILSKTCKVTDGDDPACRHSVKLIERYRGSIAAQKK